MSGLNAIQFMEHIITPTLKALDLYSPAAAELLLGTAIQESRLTYLRQIGGGPALGVYQMEPNTHDDIWENYLMHRYDLKRSVVRASFGCDVIDLDPRALVGNLYYATAMARVHYLRVPEALPKAGDLIGQAEYWKEHYNTLLGAGTEVEYCHSWNQVMDA